MAVLSDAQREAGWTIAKLGDIATLVMGTSPKSSDVVDYPLGIPLLNGPAEFTDKYPVPVKWTEKGIRFSEPGDILFCVRATLGKMNFSDRKYAIGRGLAAIRGIDELHTRYIYYTLLSTMESILRNANGTIYLSVTKSDVENFEIPLPPKDALKRIAGILGLLDDKIEANTRLIGTLEDYIHAMIIKISDSNSFKRVAIKDLATHEKNQELPREHVEGAIHHYSLPAYDSGKTPGVEEADSIKSNKFIIDKPCVLFSKLNPGTPRIWLVNPEDGIKSYASTEFIVLTPKENVDIANLWAACSEGRISQNLADMASGTSTSHQRVRPADILNSKVLDLNDQSEIRSITSYIEALRKENLQLAETRDALIKRLIG